MAKETKKDRLTEIVNYLVEQGQEGYADVLRQEIEKLTRKRSASNEKAKAETLARAEKVYDVLATLEEPATYKDIIENATDEEVKTYSPNRMTALISKLGDRVIKEKIKGIIHYSIA